MTPDLEQIKAALRAHEIGHSPWTNRYDCPCGWVGSITFTGRSEAEDHRAQAVAALMEQYAADLRAQVDGLRKFADGSVRDEVERLRGENVRLRGRVLDWMEIAEGHRSTGQDLIRRAEAAEAEVERLQLLVGDESVGDGKWDSCDRAEAIRQATEFHAGRLKWIDEHDKRRAERDAALARAEDAEAEVERLTTAEATWMGQMQDAYVRGYRAATADRDAYAAEKVREALLDAASAVEQGAPKVDEGDSDPWVQGYLACAEDVVAGLRDRAGDV